MAKPKPLSPRMALNDMLQVIDLRLAALAHPEPDGHGDLADRDAASRTQARLVESRARLMETRALCVAALIRIEERTFGVCVDCVEPIAEARLMAIPYAPRCASCQATAERTPASPLDMATGDKGYEGDEG